MNLVDYLNSLPASAVPDFAKKAGTTPQYLAQLKFYHGKEKAYRDGKKKKKTAVVPSLQLAQKLVAASDGQCTLAELRPDIWGVSNSTRQSA